MRTYSRFLGIVILFFTLAVTLTAVWRFSTLAAWWNRGTDFQKGLIALAVAQVVVLLAIAARAGIKLYLAGGSERQTKSGTLDENELPVNKDVNIPGP